MSDENQITEESEEEVSDLPKLTFFECLYLGVILLHALAGSVVGLFLIIKSDEELATGPALIVVGSVMAGITILKFTAERKNALNPEKLHKAVFGLETMVGIAIAIIGIGLHLFS